MCHNHMNLMHLSIDALSGLRSPCRKGVSPFHSSGKNYYRDRSEIIDKFSLIKHYCLGPRTVRQTVGEETGDLAGLQFPSDLLSTPVETRSLSVYKCVFFANHRQALSSEPICHLATLAGKLGCEPRSQVRRLVLIGIQPCVLQ